MLPLELLLLSAATVGARGDQLMLPANSPRIQYQPSQSNSSSGAPQGGPDNFALFWGGNNVAVYGSIHGSAKDITFSLDNQTQTLNFSSQPQSGGLIWYKDGLAEGDHQLLVSHGGNSSHSTPRQPRAPESSFGIDYIQLERGAVNGNAPQFEPARIGTTATSVPSSARLLDDTSTLVTTYGEWTKSRGAPLGSYWYNSTALSTSSVNSSLVLSFNGTAVWCYGTRYPGGGSAEVTLDGERIDSFNAMGYEQQYPLWSRQNLEPCPHTLRITTTNCPTSSCASCTGQSCSSCIDPCLSIDFFRYLDQGGPPSDKPFPQSPGPDHRPPPPPPEPDYRTAEIIAGTVGGTLLLLIIVIMFLAWHFLFVQPTTYKKQALYND